MTKQQNAIVNAFVAPWVTLSAVDDNLPKAQPSALDMVRARHPRLAESVRTATSRVAFHDCPFGFYAGEMFVGLISRKLKSPNKHRAHWTMANADRATWEKDIRTLYADARGAATWADLEAMGLAPRCTVQMNLQVVRLVMTSSEFIKDDDNLPFSRKGLTDAMKRVGLIKDDRRELLVVGPQSVMQDVTATDCYLTVFFLWPF